MRKIIGKITVSVIDLLAAASVTIIQQSIVLTFLFLLYLIFEEKCIYNPIQNIFVYCYFSFVFGYNYSEIKG